MNQRGGIFDKRLCKMAALMVLAIGVVTMNSGCQALTALGNYMYMWDTYAGMI